MTRTGTSRRSKGLAAAAATFGCLALTASPLSASAAGPDITPIITNHGASDVADAYNGIVAAPDGGTYNVGYQVVSGTNRALLITKANADGTLDTSFGTDGRAVIDLVSEFHEAVTTNPGGKETVKGVAVDNLDRLLIVGEIEGDQSTAASAVDTDIFVARVHPSGALDRSYGTGGWTRISFGDGVNPAGGNAIPDAAGWDIFVRPNQKAIIAASIGTDSAGTRTGRDAAAIQFTSAGKLDTSFGDGGVASIETPFSDNLRRGFLDDDGSFFTGSYANVGMNNQPFIQKFTPDGTPDASWGNDGLATAYPGGKGGFAEAYGLHKDANGNYIVSAYGYQGGRTGAAAGNSVDAVLFSLKPNGSLNTAWGDRGFVGYHMGEDGNNSGDRHRDHTILPDGRIVGIGGTSGTSDALVTLTLPDGTPGTAKAIDFGGADDYLWGITTIGNGYQVVAAGYGNGDAQLVTLDFTPAASAVAVQAGAASAPFGAANTASITLAVAGEAAAGTVDVALDGAALSSVSVGASGTATVDLPRDLKPGSHTLTAKVADGVGVKGSEGSSSFTVTKASTSSTVSVSKASAVQQATATIKVAAPGTPSGFVPTGAVTVYDGSKKIATATLKAADKGTVKVKLPKLSAKTHTIKATYAGNSSVSGSSATAKVKVAKAASKTSVKLSKSTVKKSQQATVTVKLAASGAPKGYAPTGTVTVYDGSKKVATVKVKASDKGTVKVKLPKLSVKTHTIKVNYGGSSEVAASSASAKLKVTK
ncbi:Ig-like domain repeat protein [Tessaracoccus caeni]|uniref:Ig-like domain repeat protein n=1 Tax=Tessaracoccus caeni TaxID=3031239 RepID=UPI0023D98DE1|nr:Ig-like domain repeat protein [Tessaracoccus caeni]MDF1486997.1 Ig-like domain repeat protein [Tessaracoccus caeni]